MRRTAGYNLLYHKRNDDISEELKIQPVEKKLAQYKWNSLNHVSSVEDIRQPQQPLDDRPVGRQRHGRLLEGLQNGYNSEAETGHWLA
jgi:hypothetical protein